MTEQRLSNVLPLKLPKIQPKIPKSSLFLVNKIAAVMEEYNVPRAVPERIKTAESSFFPTAAAIKIKINPLKKAEKKAAALKAIVEVKMVAITAPRVAPPEIPKSPGSESSFLKKI